MEPVILYQDRRVLVARKPWGVLSTDEPGGMPELLREKMGEPQGCVRTVHRLDRVVGGLMVFARSAAASRELSRQVREHQFRKGYLAVIHGTPPAPEGALHDLLLRDPATRMTRVVTEPQKGVRSADLTYRTLETREGLSLVEVSLGTGRTHQIRVQFASRGLPLVGDKRYGRGEEGPIALWSCFLGFYHPETGAWLEFSDPPPDIPPWTVFLDTLALIYGRSMIAPPDISNRQR